MHIARPVLLAVAAAMAVACSADQSQIPVAPRAGTPLSANETLTTLAVVRYVDLEGGCWALDTPQGSYMPAGLAMPYRHSGLEVYVVMRGAPALVSICQMGPLITLDSIRAR